MKNEQIYTYILCEEEGYYLREHVALAHKRLIVIDPHGGKQPMVQNGTILGTKQNRSQMRSEQNRTGPKCALIYYLSKVRLH